MDYNIKKLEKSEVEIIFTIPDEVLQEARIRACEEISKDLNIKGFRPGHIPPDVLEKHIGKKHIDAHAAELAVQRVYAEIVVKEKIAVIARPNIEIEKEEPLTIKARVAVMPEVEIKDHQSIKVKKDDVKVQDKDIEAVMDDMKKYATTYKDVQREAQKGDRVELDFEGFDDKGVSLENTKSSNHPVILGEGSLIPGFEDEVIGMKKDEEKEFGITFPKDYGKKDFQNKKVKFKVKLNRIEEAIKPEIDEDFIEKMTAKKQSVDEFKKEIEVNLLEKMEQEAKQKQENEYIEELLKIIKVELPQSLLDEEAHYILQEMKENIESKKVEFAKFLEQTKTTEEELLVKYRPEGERRIKIRLALQHLMTVEKIEITEEEIKAELEKTKSFYPEDQHPKIQEEFEKGHLKTQFQNRLALGKLFDKVLIK